MRLLVCGRDLSERVDLVLGSLPTTPEALIYTADGGADVAAAGWASARGIPTIAYPIRIRWARDLPAIEALERAIRMLEETAPTAVIAFPGSGSEQIVRAAISARIPAYRVSP